MEFMVLALLAGLVPGDMARPVAGPPETVCPQPHQPAITGQPDLQRIGGKGGLVVLLLDVDACGRVLRSRIERSSLRAELDDAARRASASWVIDPAQLAGKASVRLPVTFDGFPRKRDWPPREDPDPCLHARPSIPVPTFDGDVPGYVEDPCGFGYGSLRAAMDAVADVSFYSAETESRHAFHAVRDAHGPARWYFSMEGARHHPTAFKLAIVNDGEREYHLTSHRCELDADACARFVAELKAAARQAEARERSYLSSFMPLDAIPD